jgi:cell division protein FtsX
MRYLLEEAFSNIRHGGIVSFLSVVIITLTIATAAAFALIVNYLNEEVKGLKNEPAIIAFLKCTLDGSEGRELRSQIEKFDRITSVVYVSKAAALARSGQAFGELGEIIMQGFEDINPLPASLEIHLKDSSLNRSHEADRHLANWEKLSCRDLKILTLCRPPWRFISRTLL